MNVDFLIPHWGTRVYTLIKLELELSALARVFWHGFSGLSTLLLAEGLGSTNKSEPGECEPGESLFILVPRIERGYAFKHAGRSCYTLDEAAWPRLPSHSHTGRSLVNRRL